MKPVHFLITRFNVKMPWEAHRGWYLVDDDKKTEGKLELFESRCLPSIRRQSIDNFTWLIFLDTHTQEFVKRKFDRWCQLVPYMKLVFVDEFTPTIVSKFLFDQVGEGATVVTTRIDSDDMFASGALEAVQRKLKVELRSGRQLPFFLNFKKGFSVENGIYANVDHLTNAFCSFADRATPVLKNCHHFNHNKILDSGLDVVVIDKKRRWFCYLNGSTSHLENGRSFITDPGVTWSRFSPVGWCENICRTKRPQFWAVCKINFFVVQRRLGKVYYRALKIARKQAYG